MRFCQHLRNLLCIYDKGCTSSSLNGARKEMFTQKRKSMEFIPPTSDTFFQHVKRAAYQAGHIWGQALQPAPSLPSPSDWGWIKGPMNLWEPKWSTLPPACQSLMELLKCGCQPGKGCLGRCKCVKANLLCTAMCKCGGMCDRG